MPPAAPALGEGAGENTRQVGEQVTLEEVRVGKGVWILNEVNTVRGRADPAGETPPEASEVALCEHARFPVHVGPDSASTGCGAARDRREARDGTNGPGLCRWMGKLPAGREGRRGRLPRAEGLLGERNLPRMVCLCCR